MQPEISEEPSKKDLYNEIIRRITPIEIILDELDFLVRNRTIVNCVTVAKLDTAVINEEQVAGDGQFLFDVTQWCNFGIEGDGGAVVASGKAKFRVRLKIDIKPETEFWTYFLFYNLRLYTQPALRDLIASLAARASIVARVLPSVAVMQKVSSLTLQGETL